MNLKYLLIFLLLIFFSSFKKSINNDPFWVVTSYDVNFKIKNAKLNVTGKFFGLIAKINFNELKLNQTLIEASIDVNTIKTGIDLRDNHLKKSEYFNALKYPKIEIKVINVSKENNIYTAKCTVKIKGISKDILFPFSFKEKLGLATFTGTIPINRLDFGIGSPSVIMANKLEVFIQVVATKN